MSFFIAMQNRRATASYRHPDAILSERTEFLIVSRSGARNEFLSISEAGACTGREDEAPAELAAGLMVHATLVSQGIDDGELFLVERDAFEGAPGPGHPIGGDGYILLHQSAGELRLSGTLRFRPGDETRAARARCVLLGPDEPGVVLHLWAAHVPWSRELLPAGFRGDGDTPPEAT